MNRLKRLAQSRLTATQLQFIAVKTMTITEPLTESDLFIQRQHAEMKETISRMEGIYAHSRVNEKTAEHAEADEKLDDILTGIRNYLKGLHGLEAFDAPKAEAAHTMLTHMESYGPGLYHGGFEKQAALVSAFLTSIQSDQFSAEIETCGISHLIEGLLAAHNKVNQLYQEKLEAVNRPESTLTEEKIDLRYRINGLLTYLDINMNDAIEPFVHMEETLNLLITDVMTQFRAKQTRKEHSNTIEVEL